MDRDAMRKAQQASRDAYLRKRAVMREKAASVVLQEKITEIEAGVLPSSLTEIELLTKRAQEVKAAEQLQVAANMRQAIITEEGEPVAKAGRPLGVEDSQPFQEIIDQGVVNKRTEAIHNFVAMNKAVIDERIEKRIYVEEVTEEEIRRERLATLQSQNFRLQEQRRTLPIYGSRAALLEVIRNNPVVIIVGETGSGKTTQLLQYLYEENFHETAGVAQPSAGDGTLAAGGEVKQGVRRLICTQPRRLAAIGVAERVAQEMNTRCGSIVGYKVRFDDRTGPLTRVLFLTDGMMLKEIVGDPNLDSVAAIMVDEAHERSLNTDILLGLLKDIVRGNKQLRVIVASATINADKFSDFFDKAPVFTVKGRSFPVDISYIAEPVADYVKASVECILMLHATKPLPGDILVFLPGQEEIENCAAAVRAALAEAAGQLRPLLVLPVYSTLPPHEQRRIYEVPPPNARKVVIATNIAETSITIDGIVYVVDCGLCKQNYYNHRAMVEELRVLPISQASATQRAGRAGRTREGDCYRLYTTYTFHNEFPSETVPEILRSSMSTVVLQLKALGINNLLQFEFIDSPSTASLERALDHLYLLGAMKQDGRLTVTGRRMAEFPLDPSLSKCVIRASALGCLRHMAIAVAMLSLDSIFVNPRDPKERVAMMSARDRLFSSCKSDIVGYVRLMEGWLRSGSLKQDFCDTNYVNAKSLSRARDVLDQILKTCERIGLNLPSDEEADSLSMEALTKALLSGFFMNVSLLSLDKRTYVIVRPIDPTVGRVGVTGHGASGGGSGSEESAAELHPSSCLFRTGMNTRSEKGKDTLLTPSTAAAEERPHLVVFTQLRCTKKRYMMHVTAIPSPEWVLAVAPVNYFTREELEVNLHKRKRA